MPHAFLFSSITYEAAQMWTLGRFLPFAIGHMILEGDENWSNFLRLLEIMDILFSRRIRVDECGFLESLISDHHLCFRDLYPDVPITMKMHSMVHMPQNILKWVVYTYLLVLYIWQTHDCICSYFSFGPPINHWTMRFEAKHKYFKHLANVIGNFTNVCYSLALRHQLHQCYLSVDSNVLPGEEMEIGPGYTCTAHVFFCVLPPMHSHTTIYMVTSNTAYIHT